MILPSLKKVHIGSSVTASELARLLLQFISYVSESLTPLLANEEAVSVTQDVTLVAATPKVISHMLPIPIGKTPAGWRLTDIDANTTVRRNAWDDKTITLQAAANCNIKLKVW